MTTLLLILLSLLTSTHEETVIRDYQEGLHIAKEQNKPVFLLFTGYSCQNNEKMADLLKKSSVVNQLEKFVQVHLYVDDRTELGTPYTAMVNGEEVKIRTLGDKWAALQMQTFGTNYQPLIYVIDHEENIIGGPEKYDPILEMGLPLFLAETAIMFDKKAY